MVAKPLPPQALLRQLLHYEPETGKLFWKPRDSAFFASQKSCNNWNSQRSGKEAFAFIDDRGYCVSCILGRKFSAHRIIWKLVYGDDPRDIDHINGDRSDNRVSNLRSVSRLTNCRNKKLQSNNTHGHIGVYLEKEKGLWRAQIRISGVLKGLGRFKDFNDAVAARKAAEIEYGFHRNHGQR